MTRPLTTCIGVDPGTRDGACVLMRGTKVLDWVVWWTQGGLRGARKVTGGSAEMWERVTDLVEDWRDDLGTEGWRLSVEGLRAYPGMSNHQDMLTLAFSAGEVSGVLRPHSVGDLTRPLSTEWRPMVLGLRRRMSAKAAEDWAVQLAPGMFRWAGGWPEDLRKDARGALAEAACIARWGVLCRS